MSLQARLANHILVLDGAMGTSLQNQNLTAEDFGGEAYNGCNEYLILSKPEAVAAVHESYLKAGADIIETNTFGGTPLVLNEYGLGHLAHEINLKSAQLAVALCKQYSTPDKPRFVAGSIGPTTKALSVTGGISFDALVDEFEHQAMALIEGGVDFLLLETALDTLNLKAGYCGLLAAFEKSNKTLPIAISVTIETMGSMLAGQGIEALYTSVEHMNPLYIGLNCATGPEFMRDHIRSLAAISRFPISVVPNAGIPLADGTYPEGAIALSATLASFMKEGWVNLVGGCCGTTPDHIEKLVEAAKNHTPRTVLPPKDTRISGIDPLVIEEGGRPYIVGERTNVIGSRAFKTLITEEKFEEAAEVARKQVRAGAHVIDVCLSNPDRNEITDIATFMGFVAKMVKVPFMIDSQVPEVVETAFKLTQGKCILNSVNLEDGEKTLSKLLPIVKKYGAAVVVGCIQDEMAVTAQAKLKVAQIAHKLITEKYGIPEEDLIFDPLVFPCGTGDENYFGSGKETIEGVRLIKEAFPKCKTVLGISNVSFGLPGAGREVLNSVFLYYCTKAGLDYAIVNSEKLERFAAIPDEEKRLCDDLLWYRTDNNNDPVANFAAHFRNRVTTQKETFDRSTLSTEKKLEINIVSGTKEYLIENLDEALTQGTPLEVINGPLMAAMDIVGRMFNENELIVAEVLQSAEVMKSAVAYLEPMMEKTETTLKGTLLLATVKGDVHDIGKNLVEIILGNNGFKIIDLGIKCPPETLIEAYKTHRPQLIGLSGLLVKSAQQMVITAQDLKAAGIAVPILVGGAALTESFTNTQIAPNYDGPVLYCKDAMNGLSVANALVNPDKRDAFLAEHKAKVEQAPTGAVSRGDSKRSFKEQLVFDHSLAVARPPHFDPVIVEGNLSDIWNHINPQMLYGNHMGLKGNVKKMLETGDAKALSLVQKMDTLKQKILTENLMSAKAMYQFFKTRTEGDAIVILDPVTLKEKTRFRFPRQSEGLQLCLSDFVNPEGDTICLFIATCGDGVMEISRKLLNEGQYFEAHALSAIALESAEGFSEWLHQDIRKQWGIPDPADTHLEDLFKLKYSGVRVSFGYPACPRLEDQAILWELMHPDSAIGVTLSEEFMMHPEASVSAMVFHHPQARYFTVSNDDVAAFEAGL
ncbi:MAG: methionine synthase [Candidatus Margulisiibacteriota bacterium]